MSQEKYAKEVGRNAFFLEWIPFLVMGILLCLSFYLVFFATLHILLEEDFVVGDYLLQKVRSVEMAAPFLAGLYGFFSVGRKKFRLMKEKPFSSISDEKLTLEFGKDSFTWDHIRSVYLEGQRKLIVAFEDSGKCLERTYDLKWLSKKEDFIQSLGNECQRSNIPYEETEMTSFSRIGLYIKNLKLYFS